MRHILFILLLLTAPFSSSAQHRSLDYFMGQALTNSPLLKDFQNQVASNRIDSLQLLAQLSTKVTGNAAAGVAPYLGGWGYDYAITNGGGLLALVSVTHPLMSRDNVATQVQALNLQKLSVQNLSKTSAQDLKTGVAGQYITTLGDRLRLDFNQEVLGLLRNGESVLKRLTEQNVYRQTDYLSYLTTIQQQELMIRQLESQWYKDLSTLNYLCGINDTSRVDLDYPDLQVLPMVSPIESAFYTPYLLDSLRIRNSDEQIDFSYRPKANIVADAGFNSSFVLKGYRNFGASFGVNLTVPIYDGQQRKLMHGKNFIAEQTRENYARFFSGQFRQQIAMYFQQLKQTEQLIDDTNNQIKYSRSLLEANGKLLQTGDARIADYILALNNYLNAQNLATDAKINRLLIINQLNYWSLK